MPLGSQLKSVIEEARGEVAALIGASSREIDFTGSATESNNTALHAALSADPAKRHLITSAVEHSAVLNHTIFLEKLGYRVTRLPLIATACSTSPRSQPPSPLTPPSFRSCGPTTRRA